METHGILAGSRAAASKGMKALDALHLACAQAMKCDIFLTVDKGILRKAGVFDDIRILSPIDFVIEREGV